MAIVKFEKTGAIMVSCGSSLRRFAGDNALGLAEDFIASHGVHADSVREDRAENGGRETFIKLVRDLDLRAEQSCKSAGANLFTVYQRNLRERMHAQRANPAPCDAESPNAFAALAEEVRPIVEAFHYCQNVAAELYEAARHPEPQGEEVPAE